ncbi:MAG: hypothetical protein ABL959_15480, partial [Pyrinomonadaceae bacterium]
APTVVNAQICTLTAGGASYLIPAASHYDATQTSNLTGVGTGDYLFEDGWWFRVSGDTQEFFFPAPTTTTCAGAGGTITWSDVSARGLFSATNTLALSSSAANTGELVLTMSITNLTASPLTITLFHAADFDVNGTAGTDNGTLLTANSHMRFTDTTTGSSDYKSSTPASNAFLVRPFAAATDVFGLLGDTAVNNFDNTTLPAASIDVTAGYQWNLNIPASGTGSATVTLTGNSALPVGGPATTAGQVIISEFRQRGPSGANDEFIEVYNTTGAPLTAQSADASSGLAVVASDGTARCVIPNGTVLPAGGHYMCTNSVAYSLSGSATGDTTYTTDIPDNSGLAIFNSSTPANFILANRLDAVGFTTSAALYKEGAGLPTLTPFSIDYSFVRKLPGVCTVTGTVGCSSGGTGRPGLADEQGLADESEAPVTGTEPQDTDDNVVDFYFVDTNGTSAGAGQRLGAPGPENLASPGILDGAANLALFDTCAGQASPPNQVRDFTSDPPNNSTFGTLDFRRTFTNTSASPITRLRFRIVEVTTFPAPSGFADLRPRNSSNLVVTADRPPCGAGTSNLTVNGTTLEQPPSQPNGGGFNSSWSVPAVSGGTPLAAGAAIDLRFLTGIQQTGTFQVCVVAETIPVTQSDVQCMAPTTASADLSITKTDGVATAVPGGSVTYTITASNAGPTGVTGATVADTFPASLTATWTCVGAGGGTCTAAGAGNINDTVNLPAGGSVTYTASATISASATGSLVNTATVSSATTDPNPANNSATDTDTLTPQANLGITKTDGVASVTAGGSTTYTITASNAGPSNATGATVADTFPAAITGVTWTCVGAGGGTCPANGTGNINSSVNLPAGGSVTFTAVSAISIGA